MVKRSAEKLPPEERNSDDVGIIETYGKQVDFSDRAAIVPLVEYVRKILMSMHSMQSHSSFC